MLELEKAFIERLSEAIQSGTQKSLAILSKEFNTPIQTYTATGWVFSNCSDIIFINYTPVTVTTNGSIFVNNYELVPGGFVGFMGNNAEINRDSYNVVFESAAVKIVVIKKLYMQK